MKKWLSIVLCVLMVAVVFAGCSGKQTSTSAGSTAPATSAAPAASATPASTEPYVIGFCTALTGSVAQGGNAQKFGAELAVKEINAKGGINGRMLELYTLDDASDVAQAPIVAQKFCDDKDVVAVIAHGSSTMTAASQPIFEEAGLCNISPCSSTASLADNNMKQWLRLVISNKDQVPQVAAFAKNNLGKSKLAILYANDDNGATYRDAAKAGAAKVGLQVVAEETYNPGTETDFSTVITKIKAAGADCYTFSGDYSDGGAVLKQFHEMSLDIPMITLSGLTYRTTLDIAGEGAIGHLYCLCTFNVFSERTVSANFRTAYKANFGKDELPTGPSMGTYDAVYMIAQALQEGATRKNMAAWIKNLDNVHPGKTFTMKDICLGENITWTEKGEVASFGISPVCVDKDLNFADYGKAVDTTGLF